MIYNFLARQFTVSKEEELHKLKEDLETSIADAERRGAERMLTLIQAREGFSELTLEDFWKEFDKI